MLRCESSQWLDPNVTVTVRPDENLTFAVEVALAVSNYVIVTLLPGTYDITSTITVRTAIDDPVKFRRVELNGAGKGRTILDAHWSARHFSIPRQGCLHLTDLTVSNGNATVALPDNPQHHNVGGGALVLGEFVYANITNVEFCDCVAHSGPGAIFAQPRVLCHVLAEANNCSFTGNNGTTAGAIELFNAQFDFDGCSFSNNQGGVKTGAISSTFDNTWWNRVPARVVVLSSQFERNRISAPGPAGLQTGTVVVNGAHLECNNISVHENIGGGLLIADTANNPGAGYWTLTVANGSFERNKFVPHIRLASTHPLHACLSLTGAATAVQ
jgi:hypothetical protein